MAKKTKKKGHGGATIALNKKAKHEYFIQERYEAGISLEGWEVKSLRAGRIMPRNVGDERFKHTPWPYLAFVTYKMTGKNGQYFWFLAAFVKHDDH